MIEVKNVLIEWIENTYEEEILQKMLDLKNLSETDSIVSDEGEKLNNNFDEQFAAGMTSDELVENIAVHLGTMASEESSSIVSDVQPDYEVKDDFDERFARGISGEEMRKRTIEHIRNLPWK